LPDGADAGSGWAGWFMDFPQPVCWLAEATASRQVMPGVMGYLIGSA
jgi:hypothetical protein